jgi:hypothetical protein
MDIYQDCRLITFNSNDAYEKLNDDKNSSMTFSIPNMLVDSPDILYTTCGIVSAEIPVSWYLIDSDTNILNFNLLGIDYQLVLPFGNYNGDSMISTLQAGFDALLATSVVSCIVSLDLITGKLTFRFSGLHSGDHITFIYNGSDGLYRILGFTTGIDYVSETTSGYDFIFAPNPLNLLGIKQIRLCSTSLATIGNYSTGTTTSNNILACIPIDQPAWGLINYVNRNYQYGKLKSKNISTVDIQLFDELGRFLQMNRINFTFTIQMIIFRKLPPSSQQISLGQMNENLQDIENIMEVISSQLPRTDAMDATQNEQIQESQNMTIDGTQSLADDLGLLLYQ